jgi:hypothetical protein
MIEQFMLFSLEDTQDNYFSVLAKKKYGYFFISDTMAHLEANIESATQFEQLTSNFFSFPNMYFDSLYQ